jgi:hypothetical protein
MKAMIGRNEDGVIVILDDDGWTATKLPGQKWQKGLQVHSLEYIHNGTFADVEETEAAALYNQALGNLR